MSIKEKLILLLRWSEHYTKTDMVYLAEGSFWLGATKVIGIGASFLTSIAFANLLPEETYGIYRYVLSIITLLTIPTLNGIDTALTRAVARGHDATFAPALKTKIQWGLLGSIASIVLAGYYFFNANTVLGFSFLIAAVFIPVMDPANLFLAYLSGKKYFKRTMYYQASIRALASIFIIVVVFFIDSPIILLATYFISYTLLRLIFLLLTKKMVDWKNSIDDTALTYGKHLTLMKIPGIISTSLDKILVFHYIGGAALAGYYLALLPFKQIQNVLGGIHTLALPKFSLQDAHKIQSTLPKKILKSYSIVIPLLLLYLILARPFFNILYPQYTDFVFISQVFSLQLLLLPIGLMHTAITAVADKKKLYIHSTVIPIIRIVLIAILIPLYGIVGGVASILATSLASNVFTVYLFMKLR